MRLTRLASSSVSALIRPIDVDAQSGTSLIPNMALGFVSVTAQGAVRFLYSVTVAGVTTTAVLGRVNGLLALSMIASMLWPTAAGLAASKYIALSRASNSHEEARAIASYLGRVVGVATLVLGAVAAVMAVGIIDASLVEAGVIATLVASYSVATYARGLLYGIGHIPRATTWDVVSSMLALVGLAGLLISHATTDLLLAPLSVGYGIFVVVNWPFSRKQHPLIGTAIRRDIERFVLFGTIGGLASAGLAQLAMVIAKATFSADDAGQFAAALSLAAPPATFAGAAILVMSPALADLRGQQLTTQARRRTDSYARVLTSLMVTLIGILVLTSSLLLRTFYGSGYALAGRVLPILLAGVFVQAIAAPATASLLVGHSQGQKIFAGVNVCGLLMEILTTSGFVTVHGEVTSIAWGYFCGALIVSVIPIGLVWITDHHRWLPLTMKAVLGLSIVVILRIALQSLGNDLRISALFVGGFAVTWLTMSRRDWRQMKSLTVGSGD